MIRSLSRTLALSLLAVPLACSSPTPQWVDNTTTVPVVGALAETLSASTLTVMQGASASLTVTVTPSGGFSGELQFAPVRAQPGVTLSPAAIDITGSDPVTVQMTLTAAPDSTPDTRSMVIVAAAGNQAAEATLSLTVTGAAQVSVSSTSLSFAVGGAAQSVTFTQAGNAAAFTESDTCAGIATISQPTPGVFSVSPVAVGSCALTGTGNNGESAVVPISVTAH